MSTTETPVSGGNASKGKPEGTSNTQVGGRSAGGESAGGSYGNPHTGKDGDSDAGGFFGHGGQTDIDYHGSGQGGKGDAPNAATGSDSSDGAGTSAGTNSPADRLAGQTHDVAAAGQSFSVTEESGTAAAETMGHVGAEGQRAKSGEAPGSG